MLCLRTPCGAICAHQGGRASPDIVLHASASRRSLKMRSYHGATNTSTSSASFAEPNSHNASSRHSVGTSTSHHRPVEEGARHLFERASQRHTSFCQTFRLCNICFTRLWTRVVTEAVAATTVHPPAGTLPARARAAPYRRSGRWSRLCSPVTPSTILLQTLRSAFKSQTSRRTMCAALTMASGSSSTTTCPSSPVQAPSLASTMSAAS
mmetsp:Transcript_15487/g.39983  ORF Transcript_15487/g.39983 Transcript_15487/m.39983 type:complete len:209 (+) Transcript_15487:160-786(+)